MLDTSQREEETKRRMSEIKTRNTQRVEYYSVHPTVAPAQLPPLGVMSPEQMELWKQLPRLDWQPRLHERTQSEPIKRFAPRSRQLLFSYEPRYALV